MSVKLYNNCFLEGIFSQSIFMYSSECQYFVTIVIIFHKNSLTMQCTLGMLPYS